MQAVLAVYNWPSSNDRFRRVQRFIEFYFQTFEGLHKPPYHPKWKSINLAANVPGWTRYWVADEMLKQMAAAKAPPQRPASRYRRVASKRRGAVRTPRNRSGCFSSSWNGARSRASDTGDRPCKMQDDRALEIRG